MLAALTLRTKISTNMMIGIFSLAPLFAIEVLGARGIRRLRRLALRLAALVTLGALAASPVIAVGKAWYSRSPEDADPRKEIAQAATRFWRDAAGTPLAYVAGSYRYDNAVAFYSADRPHAFTHFDEFGNRWVTPGLLAEKGLLSVCVKDDGECAASTARFATSGSKREEMTLSHDFLGHSRAPVTFIVTVIPPVER